MFKRPFCLQLNYLSSQDKNEKLSLCSIVLPIGSVQAHSSLAGVLLGVTRCKQLKFNFMGWWKRKSDFGVSEHVFKIYVKYKAWMKTRTGVIMLSSMEGGILEEKIITATLFMKCYAWNKCQKVNNTEYFFVWQISFSQFWLIILSEITEKSAVQLA